MPHDSSISAQGIRTVAETTNENTYHTIVSLLRLLAAKIGPSKSPLGFCQTLHFCRTAETIESEKSGSVLG